MRCHVLLMAMSLEHNQMTVRVTVDVYMCMHGSAVRDAAGAFRARLGALCLPYTPTPAASHADFVLYRWWFYKQVAVVMQF